MAKPRSSKPAVGEDVVRHDRDGFIRCRVCGCTEREPCEPPCYWEKGQYDLCSNCAGLAVAVVAWLDSAHHPSFAALRREVKAVVEAQK